MELAHVPVRRQQFVVGRPIEFDGVSPRIAALEYALGAVAGEVVNGLRTFASRRRIDIDRIEAVVTGELERETAYLEAVGEPGQPKIVRIHLKVCPRRHQTSQDSGAFGQSCPTGCRSSAQCGRRSQSTSN